MPIVGCDLSTTLSMYQLWRSHVALGCRRCNETVNKAPPLLQMYCTGCPQARQKYEKPTICGPFVLF